jgi:hypothetical protein
MFGQQNTPSGRVSSSTFVSGTTRSTVPIAFHRYKEPLRAMDEVATKVGNEVAGWFVLVYA